MPKKATYPQKCLRCNHEFNSRTLGGPQYCPRCTNPHWRISPAAPPTSHFLPGYVYLMEGGGYQKIGFSKNPPLRRQLLNVGLPFTLEIGWLIRVDRMKEAEKILHKTFDVFRVRGEWFQIPEEIFKPIKDLKIEGVIQLSLSEFENFISNAIKRYMKDKVEVPLLGGIGY